MGDELLSALDIFNYYCKYKGKDTRFEVQNFLLIKLNSRLRKFILMGYFHSCNE